MIGLAYSGFTRLARLTYRTECVAEANNKPLFPITCGDLGISPKEVEAKLQEAFQLAQLWNCVLLLDEADVFLAQRSEDDVERNALVSVFLRILEYYEGILFLTSNRVGVFDEAFKSRIHMALYYPPLTLRQTQKIWNSHLNKLHNSGLIKLDHRDILDYADDFYNRQKLPDLKIGPVWNGRQIRNAFQSAVALAGYKHEGSQKILLTRDDFERVSAVSDEFNHYLWSVQGRTDSDKALSWGVRHDSWAQPGSNHYQGQATCGGGMARSIPRDFGAFAAGLSAAAAGPLYPAPRQPFQQAVPQIVSEQTVPVYPHNKLQQMPMTEQTAAISPGYSQPGHQPYQQPLPASQLIFGHLQQTNPSQGSYKSQPGQPAHHSQIPAQPQTAALGHSNTTFVLGHQQQQQLQTGQVGPGTQQQSQQVQKVAIQHAGATHPSFLERVAPNPDSDYRGMERRS